MSFPTPNLNGWSWSKYRTYKGIQIWTAKPEGPSNPENHVYWLFQEFDDSEEKNPVGGMGHAPTLTEAFRQARGNIDLHTDPFPSDDQLEYWVIDSVVDAVDGCQVEPDGICPHGCKSWLTVLGLI
jgi:hypothetical protein